MFKWNEYRPIKQNLQTVLSPLESEIMEIMWKEKRASALTIHTLLKAKHSIRRPTVNVAMGSLYNRGLLKRQVRRGKGGLKYIYRIGVSRARFEREVVDKVLDSLLESYKKTSKKLMREKLKQV